MERAITIELDLTPATNNTADRVTHSNHENHFLTFPDFIENSMNDFIFTP